MQVAHRYPIPYSLESVQQHMPAQRSETFLDATEAGDEHGIKTGPDGTVDIIHHPSIIKPKGISIFHAMLYSLSLKINNFS